MKLMTTNTTKLIKKYKPNQIVDFTKYLKHKTLTDNEFLYYKRVGNSIEYVECPYSEINPSKKLNPLVAKSFNKLGQKKKTNNPKVSYLTISKNVSSSYFKFQDYNEV